MLAKGSDEEKHFIDSVAHAIKNTNMAFIQNTETLEEVVMTLLFLILKNCGKDTQKLSKSQNTPKHGRTINANFPLIDTDTLEASKIGVASKIQSRIGNGLSLMTKSKKL